MKKMMKGFTLVEIMIVVAIIAILAAVAIPNFVKYRQTSQKNACISNLKQIQSAAEQVRMEGKTTIAESDIFPTYIKVKPSCPAGGTYTLPTGQADYPTCSLKTSDGHKLPDDNGQSAETADTTTTTTP